jgi:IS1 family transposase
MHEMLAELFKGHLAMHGMVWYGMDGMAWHGMEDNVISWRWGEKSTVTISRLLVLNEGYEGMID